MRRPNLAPLRKSCRSTSTRSRSRPEAARRPEAQEQQQDRTDFTKSNGSEIAREQKSLFDEPADDFQSGRNESGPVRIQGGCHIFEPFSQWMAAIQLHQCGSAFAVQRAGVFQSTDTKETPGNNV